VITDLGGATIWSEDINNLLPFYRDVVGLQVGVATPDFVVFGDQTKPALALGTHSEVHGRTLEPARHMIGLITDNIRGDAARLKAAGVRFIEEPNDQGGGFWLATFEDPDGNLIQLFQFERGGR
jgi:predicted enzyme related to lactoylglutathione lyase